ncbi:MAG TPA: hypothetical protein VKM54_23175 [Myxococcota bacterium]|nr:hypothetical protein [Myxococcota bacterium]
MLDGAIGKDRPTTVGEAKKTALDRSGVRLPPPLILMAGWAVGFLIQAVRPLHILPMKLAGVLGVVGWILVALALVLVMSAVLTFRGVGTSPNPKHSGQKQKGPEGVREETDPRAQKQEADVHGAPRLEAQLTGTRRGARRYVGTALPEEPSE